MAATTVHRLTLDPMGKCSNAFFSETTNQTESKLDSNVLYEYNEIWVNVNETTTPKSNCIRNAFFSETNNQIQSKLHRNVHWIFLYKV